jgi:hypothetical protein
MMRKVVRYALAGYAFFLGLFLTWRDVPPARQVASRSFEMTWSDRVGAHCKTDQAVVSRCTDGIERQAPLPTPSDYQVRIRIRPLSHD